MILRAIPLYITLLFLSACSMSDLPFVYQREFQQGTDFQAEDVERLEVGMSRQQVRFLIGTPDINDPFNQDRWDYMYRFRPSSRGDGEPKQKQLTVYFDGDRLVGAEGKYVEEGSALRAGVPSRSDS